MGVTYNSNSGFLMMQQDSFMSFMEFLLDLIIKATNQYVNAKAKNDGKVHFLCEGIHVQLCAYVLYYS